MGKFSGSPRWDLTAITGIPIRGRQGEIWRQEGKGNVMMEAGTGVMHHDDKGGATSRGPQMDTELKEFRKRTLL